jgi:hypothetical protein
MLFDNRQIEANQARMESARSGFDAMCGEIARMLLPDRAGYSSGSWFGQGQSGTNYQYDEYGAMALADGVSLFEGFTMPRGQEWQKIRVSNQRIMDDVVCARWLEEKTRRLFELRNDPESGYAGAVHQSAENLLSLWGQSIWIDHRYDASGRRAGLSYCSEDVGAVWVERDAGGNVMRVHRKLCLTAEQALDKWKDKAPPKVVDAMSDRHKPPRRDQRFEFLHVIERNPNMLSGRIDAAGKPWIGCYYSIADKMVFEEGGYRTLRRVVSCFARSSGEDYGRSPAMRLLPALRATQIIMQDRVLATEQMVKPPLLAPNDELDRAVIDLGPWGITYGGLDDRGAEMLKPFLDSIDLSGAKDLHAEIRSMIDRGYWRDLLQIFREQKTHITALRTSEEMSEKGVLLSPLARQEQEWHAPALHVELDLMWEDGEFDDMPAMLVDYFEAGGGVKAVYDNLLSQMMDAADGASFLRMVQQFDVVAQLDPQGAVQAFKREYPLDKVIPFLGQSNGVPARLRATDEEKAAYDSQAQQAAMAQQLIEAAPALSGAVKNFAQAEAVSSGA